MNQGQKMAYESRSPRSVWVEIKLIKTQKSIRKSRSPRSVWVEMKNTNRWMIFKDSHAPHGACELKFPSVIFYNQSHLSRSPRSVWVEILFGTDIYLLLQCHAPHGACELKYHQLIHLQYSFYVTLPTERVSWNFSRCFCLCFRWWSRSPRSVWVEME